jgi:hypothetical protein
MSNIKRNYQRILEIILPLSHQIAIPTKAERKPKMPDIEVIALILTAKYMSIDSENSLFKQLQSRPIINFLDAVNTINVADSCSIILKLFVKN